eukprot:sb/3475305/
MWECCASRILNRKWRGSALTCIPAVRGTDAWESQTGTLYFWEHPKLLSQKSYLLPSAEFFYYGSCKTAVYMIVYICAHYIKFNIIRSLTCLSRLTHVSPTAYSRITHVSLTSHSRLTHVSLTLTSFGS